MGNSGSQIEDSPPSLRRSSAARRSAARRSASRQPLRNEPIMEEPANLVNIDTYDTELLQEVEQMAQARDPMETIDFYSEAIAKDSKNYQLYLNRSYWYDKSGQYKLALADANEAIKLKPSKAYCYYRAGVSLKHMKKFYEAETMVKVVSEMTSSSAMATNELVQIKYLALRDEGFGEKDSLEIALKFGTISECILYAAQNKRKQLVHRAIEEMDRYVCGIGVSYVANFLKK